MILRQLSNLGRGHATLGTRDSPATSTVAEMGLRELPEFEASTQIVFALRHVFGRLLV